MKSCPVCGREFPDNVKFCPNDGQTLRAKAGAADLVGQVVADRYHITKKLGEGGMGAVYLGEHVKMGRKSAIKVMNPSMVHDPDAISRFNREAANASRISHANVCQIYDFGETSDGLIYLAMEFIEGQALTDIIEKEGALPAPRAAKILTQTADALQAAHDLGIVHRDLKPDNIMITQARDGADVVKVVDFGIAKAVAGDESGQKVTKTGLVVGTPEYMSPEQLSGDKLDGRSDIYSLGLVFYRMLTGVLPFQADSAQETMIKRLTDDPLPLDQARPDIVFPGKLQSVIDHALARSAAERYHNAAEFGRDVADAVAGLAMPETRVDVQRVTSAATQMMTEDHVQELTKHVTAKKKGLAVGPAPEPARAAPVAPPKKFPLVPVLGGLGAVAALAVVAVVTMKTGGNSAATAQDTLGRDTQVVAVADADRDGVSDATDQCPGTPAGTQVNAVGCAQQTGGTNPPPGPGPRDTDGDGVPDTRDQCGNTARGAQVDQNGCPVQPGPGPGPTPVVSVEDSVNAAVRADQAGQVNEARRLARWVYYRPEASSKQKSDAAELVAATYEDDTARSLEWYENALRYATGRDRERIQTAVNALRGNP